MLSYKSIRGVPGGLVFSKSSRDENPGQEEKSLKKLKKVLDGKGNTWYYVKVASSDKAQSTLITKQ
jgi:hypothetical protein